MAAQCLYASFNFLFLFYFEWLFRGHDDRDELERMSIFLGN